MSITRLPLPCRRGHRRLRLRHHRPGRRHLAGTGCRPLATTRSLPTSNGRQETWTTTRTTRREGIILHRILRNTSLADHLVGRQDHPHRILATTTMNTPTAMIEEVYLFHLWAEKEGNPNREWHPCLPSCTWLRVPVLCPSVKRLTDRRRTIRDETRTILHSPQSFMHDPEVSTTTRLVRPLKKRRKWLKWTMTTRNILCRIRRWDGHQGHRSNCSRSRDQGLITEATTDHAHPRMSRR